MPSFTLRDEKGNAIRCDLLFTFDCDENGKKYLVYTDNSRDPEGNLRLFASICQQEGGEYRLTPLETEQEWKQLETILADLQAEAKNGTL